jgi:hypothetical protein
VSGALPGTLYAFVLVSALSLLMLWRLRESLLALLPLVLALAWTIGLMHLFGVLSFAKIPSGGQAVDLSALIGRRSPGRAPEGPCRTLRRRATVAARWRGGARGAGGGGGERDGWPR